MGHPFVIDTHAHTFETEGDALQIMAGNGQAGLSGTVGELSDLMRLHDVSVSVQLTVISDVGLRDAISGLAEPGTQGEHEAVREQLVDHIRARNEWTCSKAANNAGFVAFVYVDPLMGPAGMSAEIADRVENFGAKGIKIFPAIGRYFPEASAMHPVYETAQAYGVPIVSHGGLFLADEEYTAPRNFVKVLRDFPRLTFVIAHLGRIYYDETIAIAKTYPNVYFDTSSAIPGDEEGAILKRAESFLGPLLSDDEAVHLLRTIGIDRVMFGSDYPWFHPGHDIRRISNLCLSKSEKQAILGLNAQRILNL